MILYTQRMKPLVVGIAGGTASGKTTVARKLRDAFSPSNISFLDQDSYYIDLGHMPLAERNEVNFDHPDAFDTELLVSHIKELRAGRAVQKPVYDFVESTRSGKFTTVLPSDLILVEGILVLALEAIRNEMHIKIFVETEDDVRIIRRLTRDIKERGRDFDRVIAQYFKHVRPMHLAFVEPSKRYGDIVVPHGGNNDIAISMLIGAIKQRLALP
jgi:uridine kinase